LLKSWILVPCGFVGWCWHFRETCCLHLQGLEWQGREIEGLYRTWRARAEGRESIRWRKCGNRMWNNREPSGRLQGGVWVWSGTTCYMRILQKLSSYFSFNLDWATWTMTLHKSSSYFDCRHLLLLTMDKSTITGAICKRQGSNYGYNCYAVCTVPNLFLLKPVLLLISIVTQVFFYLIYFTFSLCLVIFSRMNFSQKMYTYLKLSRL
jgi:hypothetical protein